LRREISGNRSFSSRRLSKSRLSSPNVGRARLGEPKTDQQKQDKRRQGEPRDHDHLDSHFANCGNVIVDVWIAVKEAVAIAEDVGAANEINEEEERRSDSQGGKSGGID